MSMTHPLAALIAGVLPTDCRKWDCYPIEMPLTKDGHGPAIPGRDEIASITYEVWDRLLCTHASFDNLPDAINEAMRLSLAALEAATPPDLVEAGKVADRLRAEKSVISTTRTFPSGDERDMVLVPHYGPNPLAHEAADTIRALIVLAQSQAAQIAGLDAELSSGSFYKEADIDALMNRAEAAEAEAATLRAEVERLRGAALREAAAAISAKGKACDSPDELRGLCLGEAAILALIGEARNDHP